MATKITTPELFNLSSNNTAATQLPVFTTSERPTPTTSTVQVEYLVIGGGGAGGGWGGGGGAGGYLTNYGGSKTPLTSSANYAIVVGEGGVKQTVAATAANSGEDSSIIGTGISITATGGGAGGTKNGNTTEFPAQNGGSGGGASAMRSASVGGSGNTPSTTPSQGNNGGNSPAQDPNFPGGGGGGGANANGGDGQSASGSPAYAGGDGGNGLASLITGTSVTRAGGGGGFTYGISVTNVSSGGTGGGGAGGRYVSSGNSSNPSPSNAVDGQVNTGSGGGSGSVTQSGSGSSWYGGDTASGGSGIVILRYPTSSSSVIKTTGSLVYTESTDGSDTVIQFTEGSGNVSFASAGIAVGEMIFNSTTEKVEYWDGFQWNMIKDESQIILASENFNISAYTGTGVTTTDTDITSVGFKPDFAWFKGDTNTYYHVLYDSIRGTNAAISTNNTNGNYSNYNRLQSFNNDGYSIRANNAGDLWKINRTGNSFIVYGWKAGGAAVPNTNGSTASQVSANAAGGFSIVKTTGTSGAITFGHGLDTAPEMIINKGITSSGWSWLVYHKDIGTGKYLKLNSTDSTTTNSASFSSVTSTTITNNSSNSSSDYINYCFHSVAGYSKIDSFVGSGNSGNKQTTGFEPGWIMLKRTSPAGAGWYIIDNVRGANKYLSANSNGAEQTSGSNLVFESDGFSFTGSSFNSSGHEHIYIAIAT